MDENYLLHRQSITIQETEHHIDHNQETDTTIDSTVETTETIKDLENKIEVTTIEATAEIPTTGAEITVIPEKTIIIDTIIDPDTQIVVTQDETHHIIQIIILIIVIIALDKDNIAETQLEMIDIDKDQIAIIIDTTQTIILKIIEEVHRLENKKTDIIQETEITIKSIITTIIK